MKLNFEIIMTICLLAFPAGNLVLAQAPEKGAFKVTFFTQKKQGLSQEEFVDLVLNQHVPLVLQIPNLRGYVQNFVVPGSHPHIDLVTEVWFDSREDFLAGMQSEKGQTAAADAPNMVVPSPIVPNATAIPLFPSDEVQLTYPPVRKGKSDQQKTLFLLKKKADVSWEQMELVTLKQVAPHVIAFPNLRGYTLDLPVAQDESQPVHAIATLWFENKAAAEEAIEGPSAERVHYYQEQVIRPENILALPVTEYVLLSPPYRQ